MNSQNNFRVFLGWMAFIGLLTTFGCTPQDSLIPESEQWPKIELAPDTVSLTFILGEDGKNGNRFYEQANYYYQMHPRDKTDYVVHDCHSLEEVKNYLEHFMQPLSLINLVSHGNPWQGLSVPVLKEGERCSFTNLKTAFDQKSISPIHAEAVNSATRINIVSCGVGQDQRLVTLVNRFFGKIPGEPLAVSMSEHYVNFGESLQKYWSKYYFVTSKYEYADQRIIPNRLARKYADSEIDWAAAYAESEEVNEGDAYRYHFRMAVNWTFLFDNAKERDNLRSESDLVRWMQSQKNLSTVLEEMGLTFADFQWTHFRIDTEANSALKIRGFCNVDGVMKKVLETDHTDI